MIFGYLFNEEKIAKSLTLQKTDNIDANELPPNTPLNTGISSMYKDPTEELLSSPLSDEDVQAKLDVTWDRLRRRALAHHLKCDHYHENDPHKDDRDHVPMGFLVCLNVSGRRRIQFWNTLRVLECVKVVKN